MTLPDAAMSAVIARLYSRRVELERAILRRCREIVSDRSHLEDPEYASGLRAAIASIVEYALVGIGQGQEWWGPIPSAAIAQAQRAARIGVSLDTVLRRYFAGYALVWDFVMEEAARGGLLGHGDSLRRAQTSHASLLDRLLIAVTDQYGREVERARRSPELRRAELVLRLLAGGHADSAEVGYQLDAWHLGVIARGKNARGAVRDLAAALDRELLAVSRGEETVWGWLGGRQRLGSDIERLLPATWPADVSLAMGEPGRGVEGWRLTHGQAQAALRVVLRRPQRLTRYVDVALLAAGLDDEVLARSLVEIYLSPLGDRGSELRATLHAYFVASRSASSAATSLGVVRQTVENRLRTAEQAIGQPLHACLSDLEVALCLDELNEP
jgi:PucR C-terminal helix-turn-helix domain/GGDEF-like domain